MVATGMIRDREDVVRALENGGLTVVRETKKAVSVLPTRDGGRNIRLKGALYERDFRFSEKAFRGDLEAAGTAYRGEREKRVCEARAIHQRVLKSRKNISDAIHEQNTRQTTCCGRSVTIALIWILGLVGVLPIGILSGILVVSGHSSPCRGWTEMNSYSQQLTGPEKAKSGAGWKYHGRHPEEQVHAVLPKSAKGVEFVHLEKRQTGSDLHREIEPRQLSLQKRHTAFLAIRTSKSMTETETAAECVRALTGRLRDTTAGIMQASYDSLQTMFTTTSAALMRSDQACQH